MTEFNLEPPEPEPSNIEILDSWGIKPEWDREHRVWHVPGMGYLNEILEMNDEDVDILTSRDRHAVEKVINDYGEYLMSHYLDNDVWESELGWYARHMDRQKGPAINVKLHETYDIWRLLEKKFDVSLEEHEVDPQYVAYQDTIDHEFEWFKSEYIDGHGGGKEFEHLDSDKFGLGGRSGGWLIYNLSGKYETGALTLGEATELRRVWDDVPNMVTDVAREVVARQWTWAFDDLWDKAVDEWREREEEAKAEAIRTNDLAKARWHQVNLDVDIDKPDMFDMVWEALYEEISEQE